MIFFRSCAILTLRLEVQKTENGVFHLYRIFIVEDDGVIAGAVERHLESWGYQVARARKFDAVLEEFTEFDPQLVLLDISLPFFNGYHWCREIRKTSKVPILFLTSAADNVNLVMAMLRRAYDFAVAPAALLACGGAVLNVSNGTLSVRDRRVELTKNEGKLLQLLLEKKGQVVSRDAMMTALWESDSFVDENTLSVNVNRLRRKLEAAGLPEFIRTKKGAGYLVEDETV